MKNKILLGVRGYIVPIPAMVWKAMISRSAKGVEKSLEFMSVSHHLIRDFVVRELPKAGEPLSPELIADRLDIPVNRVRTILDDLEKGMTFLFRNNNGEVAWAYPVTVDKTPHHVTFNTGEELYAA